MIATRRAWIRRARRWPRRRPRAARAPAARDPSPVKETFVLEPPAPPAVAKPQPGMLRVGTITVGAPFRGRSFVFRESELKFETDYYHEFLVAPAANIGEATARALAAANMFASVVPSGVIADPDWVLEGFVDALYGDARDAAKPQAVLTITYLPAPRVGRRRRSAVVAQVRAPAGVHGRKRGRLRHRAQHRARRNPRGAVARPFGADAAEVLARRADAPPASARDTSRAGFDGRGA